MQIKGVEDLHGRDRVGVQDFVLLEDYQSEDAFVTNLQKRFKESIVYTYIGQVLVSVNPYRETGIYTDEYIHKYQNVNLYELPPHVFAIADSAYKLMREECRDQCVLISGESGAGKTEASKKMLRYLAAASHHAATVERVKDRLLQSNPVLEAFGNAKTNRNDNSSRFGKYMDIEFNYMGTPLGGHILNYLLEKTRVVQHSRGERNFHIFYQLLSGADDEMLQSLQLRRDPTSYYYLNLGDTPTVGGVEDAAQFAAVKKALSVIDFTPDQEKALFAVVASVLHMGNVGFVEADGIAVVAQDKPLRAICQLFGSEEEMLRSALTHKTIEAKGELLTSPLSRDQAICARDSLAKAVYERLFTWLVQKVNASLANKEPAAHKTLMGLLDIYGFEIFQRNSFEQFCINYCNEKLQQVFIELTLKSEQEEYRKEGIQWEPVEYFNNKVICELVESSHKGIVAILNEECLRPGEATDLTFLSKMETAVGQHAHFLTHKLVNNRDKKGFGRDEFRLLHYAGAVTYKVDGFLDKNNDLLFRDLKQAMSQTTNIILQESFPVEEITSKKRPLTAVTQFKNSLSDLMVILMSKEPWYIRCIKPNDNKQSGVFDDRIVCHQIKYLGLMENLRVRRNGFAYRRPYAFFLKRYKCLCPETWPVYKGDPKDGVYKLMTHLGNTEDDFKMGKTKIFIRFPKTLFVIEDAFQHRKHYLATKIQAEFRCYAQTKKFQQMRMSVTTISSHWRRHKAQQLLKRRRSAAHTLRSFVKGFATRNLSENEHNKLFFQCVRQEFLLRLSRSLPRSVLDRSWPNSPTCCQQASDLLREMHRRWLVQRYCRGIGIERKAQMEKKVLAEALFRGKKQSYPASIPKLFLAERLGSEEEVQRMDTFERSSKPPQEKTLYCSRVTKFDRHGYKPRTRIAVLTDGAIYLLDPKDMQKTKQRIPLASLQGISTSNLTDGLLVLRIPPDLKKDKGDLILDCGLHLVEFVVAIIDTAKNHKLLMIEDSTCISHNMTSGKQGQIEFAQGLQPLISKGKNGNLLVVAASP